MFTLIDHDLGSPMQGVKFFEFSYFDFDAVDENNRVRADPNPNPSPNPTAAPNPTPSPDPNLTPNPNPIPNQGRECLRVVEPPTDSYAITHVGSLLARPEGDEVPHFCSTRYGS